MPANAGRAVGGCGTPHAVLTRRARASAVGSCLCAVMDAVPASGSKAREHGWLCCRRPRAEQNKASRVRQGNGGRQHTLRTEQEPCSQSEPLEQDFPTAQASHAGPPQSTSVSASLCTASSHDACTTGSAAKMHAHATSNATGRSKGRFIFRGCLLSSQVACFLLCRLPCSLNTAAAPKHQSINARNLLPTLQQRSTCGVRP